MSRANERTANMRRRAARSPRRAAEVGHDARYVLIAERLRSRSTLPTRVSRFTRYEPGIQPTQPHEKLAGQARFEMEAGRQLHEHGPHLSGQTADIVEECRELGFAVRKGSKVG